VDLARALGLHAQSTNRKERAVKTRFITTFVTLTALAAALAPIATAAGRWG
jgi:hypothetical protein